MTLHGVNLGGWLVIEKWMTPSLFAGLKAANHYELAQTEKGRQRIKTHQQAFIKEADFQWLKAQAIDSIRLPVGHWINGDHPVYPGALAELDWAFAMAEKYDLLILLDLHAAVDAQNTRDHSGSGNRRRSKTWLKNRTAQTKTLAVLEWLARRYGHHPKLWGIELLNEPAHDLTGLRLAWFYRRAYRQVTPHLRRGTAVVFSDGYAPIRLTNALGLMTYRGCQPMIDVHLYQSFGQRNQTRRFWQHLRLTGWWRWLLELLRLSQPVIVGEWSATLPARTNRQQTRRFIQVQRQAFRPARAEFYWSYKTEGGGRWSFRDMAEQGNFTTKHD